MQTLSHTWRKAPFIRFLIPLIAGILLQWELQIKVEIIWIVLLTGITALITFFFIPFLKRFQFSLLSGVIITFIFLSIGSLLIWYKDIRHNKQWLGNFYSGDQTLIATLEEPPVEKTKSIKSDATVTALIENGIKTRVKGRIIIYFKKDSSLQQLTYGSQIIFNTPLQEIKNSGNPGNFDYKRYSLFQDITYQVYLNPGEFVVEKEKDQHWLNKLLFSIRERVLHIIRKNIPGEKEQGLAEALLIGYKNDLDRTLVQSYTNTGVVHLIVIAGLHLGLIFWLLRLVAKPLRRKKYGKWIRPFFIISGLWLFSLLTGGHPPVLRAAVMFTCLTIAEGLAKKTSIYNTLALSAFMLLCYNPYWVMDAGFQLSYAAVLSIVTFVKPIYNFIYFPNKILDFFWKMVSVSAAAQIFTLPLSIYHFHQFPDYFLLTNIIAVPLACMVLIGEVILCTVSFIPFLALLAGKILSFMIRMLNSYIERIELLPYSLWDGLYITISQTILLLLFMAGTSYWLMEKRKIGLKIGLIALLAFIGLRTISFLRAEAQQKIIVYNVPQRQAIDIINGRKYFFVGDSDLLADDFIRNFHLKPSRIFHRIDSSSHINDLWQENEFLVYHSKRILLLDKSIVLDTSSIKTNIDLVVFSKNLNIYIKNLNNNFNIKQIVFDGSNAEWKIKYWKKDCDSLHIPYHDVNEKGAFVMNLR